MKELTPNEAYDLYVDEFLTPFGDNVDQAVDQLMVEKWRSGEGDNYPENLPDLIKDYVVDQESIAFSTMKKNCLIVMGINYECKVNGFRTKHLKLKK